MLPKYNPRTRQIINDDMHHRRTFSNDESAIELPTYPTSTRSRHATLTRLPSNSNASLRHHHSFLLPPPTSDTSPYLRRPRTTSSFSTTHDPTTDGDTTHEVTSASFSANVLAAQQCQEALDEFNEIMKEDKWGDLFRNLAEAGVVVVCLGCVVWMVGAFWGKDGNDPWEMKRRGEMRDMEIGKTGKKGRWY